MSYNLPDEKGHFEQYGGVFIAETLMTAVIELKHAYEKYKDDADFVAEFENDLKHYVGRKSPLYHAKNLSKQLGGAQIYLKREDLNHTGAHKINNTIGQALLASRMGENKNHCRDWCRATRCSFSYRCCKAWFRVCGVYGRS